MDLTALSDTDLAALKTGDLTKLSDQGLAQLKGGPVPAAPQPSRLDQFIAGVKDPVGKNAVFGALKGAAGIGSTIMQPFQYAVDQMTGKTAPTLSSLVTGQKPQSSNQETRQGVDAGLNSLGADPNSLLFKNAKLATEIAGTSGVGGALAGGARALGAAPSLVNALGSSGFTTGREAAPGLMCKAVDMGARMLGGGATGAASAGLLDPGSAGAGGLLGAALPPSMRVVGAVAQPVGKVVAKMVTGGAVAPEVQDLAQRAAQLGIQIPADRIASSKPLNALAASLNYVPFSGRAAVENRMQDQLNKAVSKTFGQDSPNVTMALRKAQGELGGKFETTLKNNTVFVDQKFMEDLADSSNKAARELGADGAGIIGKQVDDILSKAATGEIDGQAAYNIKKTLDRIGQRNSPEAYYATDLKKSLMGALDRSLGAEEAAAFAKTRQQYGTMLDLQKLAKNGAEGDISIARLANLKNIGNPDLQELADISAQFLKPREGAHGAAQRVGAGGLLAMGGHLLGGGIGGPLALGAGAGLGRAANAALDSNFARDALLRRASMPGLLQQITDETGAGVFRGLTRSGTN